MVFNLTTRKLFKCQDHEHAIYCAGVLGPQFADSLSAFGPFNEDNAGESYVNQLQYPIETDSNNRNKLTNLICTEGRAYGPSEDQVTREYHSKFTISELEVWEVIF